MLASGVLDDYLTTTTPTARTPDDTHKAAPRPKSSTVPARWEQRDDLSRLFRVSAT
jgi:hypothetical protein